MSGSLPQGTQLGVDDVYAYGGSSPKGFYPFDLRAYGVTPLEQIMGLDTRDKKTGYAKWGQTLGTNASGDDLLMLTEKSIIYDGEIAS